MKTAGRWTALILASNNGHSQAVKELLDHGADIESDNIHGWRPLHCACFKGELAVVNELLSPNDSNAATTTILGKRKSRGADIDAKDGDGNTPLHFVSLRGHVEILQVLLSRGANILAANNDGELPINQAMRARIYSFARNGALINENSAVAKCLFQHFYATTRRLPLHELLEDLTWIGNPTSSGAPPLRAALHGDLLGTDDVVEILEYLVDRNPVLLSSPDQDGALPLHVACRCVASFAIVQFLVNRYKASVKSLTPQGDLPLFLACDMPETSLDIIFLLTKQYPDVVYR
jgi:ankyrin repeat protein